MNLSKQLLVQVERVEKTTQGVKTIWRQQSQQKKWFVGIVVVAVTGLALSVTRKIAPPGTGYLQGLISLFLLIFRLNGISQSLPSQANEKIGD